MYSTAPNGPPGPTSIRQITLAENFSLAFNTNGVYKNAVILGNVDNDYRGDVELVIGNLSGELGVFKYQRKRPWKKCSGLGAIVCLAVGDLANIGKNLLVTISAEGNCHVFDVPPDEGDAVAPEMDKSSRDSQKSTEKNDSNQWTKGEASRAQTNSTERESSLGATPSVSGRRDASLGSTTGSGDSSLPVPAAESLVPTQGESSQDQPVAPRSSTKASKTGTLSFYSSIQTEKLAALAQARQGQGTTQSDRAVTMTPSASMNSASQISQADKTSRQETHSGIATSLLEQFKKVATPSKAPEPSKIDSSIQTSPRKVSKSSDSISKQQGWKRSTDKMEPTYRFSIEPNANCAIIGDIDEDGNQELIIGSNNRAIYAYAMVKNEDALSDLATHPYVLKLKSRWHLAGHVNSLCLTTDKWGRPTLLAGLSGGTYAVVDHSKEISYRQFGASSSSSSKMHLRDDRTGPAELVITKKQIKSSDGTISHKNYVIMSSLEGLMRMQDSDLTTAPPGEKISSRSALQWELGLENQLFATRAVDITGDGQEELVVGTLDGTTYIFDEARNAVKFRFEDRCRAFVAGLYAVAPGKMRPCLFYVTYNDEITVYHKLGLKSVPVPSLYAVTKNLIEQAAPSAQLTAALQTPADFHALFASLVYDNLFDENEFEEYKRKLMEKRDRLLELKQRKNQGQERRVEN